MKLFCQKREEMRNLAKTSTNLTTKDCGSNQPQGKRWAVELVRTTSNNTNRSVNTSQ